MKNKKNLRIAVAMVGILGISIMSPITIHAQEDEKVKIENVISIFKGLESIANQNTDIEINAINFPDDIFRKYIEDNFDTDTDGKLSAEEIENAKEIAFFADELKNIESLTGISYFTNLEMLYCAGTKIESLDVSNNKKLRVLQCQSIPTLTSLIIGENLNLKKLYCYADINLDNLDISQNPGLEMLLCDTTGIKTLNLENNPNLNYLNCHYVQLTSLDVSKNLNLETLACGYSNLQGLDVSKNTLLTQLQVQETPFAWINIGVNDNLWKFLKTDADITIPVTEDTFNITEVFKGIDVNRINNIKGGTLDKTSGTMSGYKIGESIIYEYDCGQSKNGIEIQNVTLNLTKGISTIEFADSLDREYTGIPISTPIINKAGSSGIVTFTYEVWNGSSWEDYLDIPKNAGKYRVKADLAGDDRYQGASTKQTEFIISQAVNNWVNPPTITGWTYDEQANLPLASAKFGDVTFCYSDLKDGIYTNKVPTEAGTWYMKAFAAETDNYKGLEEIVPFMIAPKNIENSDIKVSDIKNDKDIENLIVMEGDKELKKEIDYLVDQKQDNNKTIVTITFMGNYIGTIIRSFPIESIHQANPDQKPTQTDGVPTGDNSPTAILVTMGMLSVSGVLFLMRKKKYKGDLN